MAAPQTLIRTQLRGFSVPRVTISFPVRFALLLAAVSLVPYLLAYLWTPPGRHFAGFFFIADDATTYLAKMRQGVEGSWLWNDPYTSEPHHGVFLFAFYLLWGHLAALLHVPLIAAYHLARLTGAMALVLAVDGFAWRLLRPELRRLSLVLATLGSGLGFLAQAANDPTLLGQRVEALDLHLPELSGWYSILAIPHFAWAAALMVFAFIGLMRIADRSTPRALLGTGFALALLAAIHPQMVTVMLIVWAAYVTVLFAWGYRPAARSLLCGGAAFALPAPLLAYSAWVLFSDPTIAQWGHQWRHQAPGIFSLVLGLGLPFLAALYAVRMAWRKRDANLALVIVWPAVVLFLLYLPNVANIQRRLLDALYVPIGLLAAVGLRGISSRLGTRSGRRLERIFVATSCLSSALVLVIALYFARGGLPEIYISADQSEALTWLSSHHAPGDRVLSSPQAGLLLPAWSGVPVYVGHYSETLDYFQKIQTEDAMLSSSTPAAVVQSFLSANGITLLYWGPEEQKGRTYYPDQQPYLQRIYQSGTVAIYRVPSGSS